MAIARKCGVYRSCVYSITVWHSIKWHQLCAPFNVTTVPVTSSVEQNIQCINIIERKIKTTHSATKKYRPMKIKKRFARLWDVHLALWWMNNKYINVRWIDGREKDIPRGACFASTVYWFDAIEKKMGKNHQLDNYRKQSTGYRNWLISCHQRLARSLLASLSLCLSPCLFCYLAVGSLLLVSTSLAARLYFSPLPALHVIHFRLLFCPLCFSRTPCHSPLFSIVILTPFSLRRFATKQSSIGFREANEKDSAKPTHNKDKLVSWRRCRSL